MWQSITQRECVCVDSSATGKTPSPNKKQKMTKKTNKLIKLCGLLFWRDWSACRKLTILVNWEWYIVQIRNTTVDNKTCAKIKNSNQYKGGKVTNINCVHFISPTGRFWYLKQSKGNRFKK